MIPAVNVASSQLAPGVWLIGGGSHNSVLVEFRDFGAVVEAPQNENRSIAVINDVQRLVPNKPIQYVVNTHHHFVMIAMLLATFLSYAAMVQDPKTVTANASRKGARDV